jgi:GntR family transcriptional regulator/MocR family aminotransferase
MVRPGSLQRGAGAGAVFVQLAAAIADDVRRGALRGGDRLPSTRAVAAQLGVNRNTVVAAYDELVAQGWAVTRGSGGTYVCEALPERAVRRAPASVAPGMAARPGFELRAVPVFRTPFGPPGARYQLSIGTPDTRLVSATMLATAYRRALRSRIGRAGLDYGDPRGVLRLRTALAAMLRATRGVPAGAENILLTRGSQMGLDLAARLLVRPGDAVCVEQLGYRPAWRALEEAGAQLVPIALDASGLVVDALPSAPPRAVHVTPHHQYPTTVLLSPARRIALLARARRDRFAIIEDDYDHEFHFDGRPVAPLVAADPGGNVIYLGTLSKILAPGLRIGFVVAAERTIESLARLRETVDRQGDQVLELAVAELIEDGELARHARKMRRIYESRRDALASALTRELAGAVRFTLPPGGMTLWARVDDSVDLEAWRGRALARGVAFVTAREFALDGRPRPFIRLGYARYDETELTDAVRRMRRALDDR